MHRKPRTLLPRLCGALALSLLTLPVAPAQSAALVQGPLEATSLLGRKLYAMPEDDAVRAARDRLAADTSSVPDALDLSQAQAGRREYQEAVRTDTTALAAAPGNADLLIERGHRELGLREFAAAQNDLEAAVAADATKLNSHYHLGLAHYFQGHFAQAAQALGNARDLAHTDDELIDCTAWLYVSLQRAGKPTEAADALRRITPAVHNTEAHLAFYLKLLHFYQGRVTEAQILPHPPKKGDTEAELAYNTIHYGVGNWHLYHGDAAAAIPYFQKATAGDAWNSWGFIGAETDLVRQAKH